MENLTNEELKIYNEGYNNGCRDGEKELRKKCVIKLKDKGYDNFYIADFFNLNVKQVEEIIIEKNNEHPDEELNKIIARRNSLMNIIDSDPYVKREVIKQIDNFINNLNRSEGFRDGIKCTQTEVALELAKVGFTVSFIAKILKIDVEKVEELLTENK